MSNNNPWDNNDNKTKSNVSDKLDKNTKNNSMNNGSYNFSEMNLFFNFLNKNVFLLAILTSIILWLFSGIYIIKQEESGVVLRFGKYSRTTTPGLHYRLPFPIEMVVKDVVTRVRIIKIGDENQYERKKKNDKYKEESLMLTGDENIVDIVFEVHWKIKDLKKFIFNIKDKQDTIIDTANSVVREVVSKEKLSSIITTNRSLIEEASKKSLQEILDNYNCGVEIIRLQMLKVDPPIEVIDSFRDVQTARVDKESEINKGRMYENKILPNARGEAGKILQEAEGYAIKVVNEAKGNVEKFNKIHEQYKLAPYATRKRIYLDAMEELFANNKFTIIDSNMKNVILNVNENQNNKEKNPIDSFEKNNINNKISSIIQDVNQ